MDSEADPTISHIFSDLDSHETRNTNRDPVEIEIIYSKKGKSKRSRSKSKGRRSSPSSSPKFNNLNGGEGISRRPLYLDSGTAATATPHQNHTQHQQQYTHPHRPYIRSASPISRDRPLQASERRPSPHLRSQSVGRPIRPAWMPFQMHHTSQELNSPSPARRRSPRTYRSSPMTVESVPSDEYGFSTRVPRNQKLSDWNSSTKQFGNGNGKNGYSQDLFEEDSLGRPIYKTRSVSRSRSPPRELMGARPARYGTNNKKQNGSNGHAAGYATPVPSTSLSGDTTGQSLSPIPRSESPPFQTSTQEQQQQQQQQERQESSIQNPFQAASRMARSSWLTAPHITATRSNPHSKSPPFHPIPTSSPTTNNINNNINTNPFFASSSSRSASKSRSPPSASPRSTFRNNNPFVSTSKSNSPPSASPRRTFMDSNPFVSTSKSSSPPPTSTQQPPSSPKLNSPNPFESSSSKSPTQSQQQEYTNHNPLNPFYSSNSRSKSRSPPRTTTHDVILEESKLHNLLSCATSPNDPQWMSALHILASSPNPTTLAQSKVRQAHSWTALHIACLSNPPLYIILALLMVYPDGVRNVDSGGRLPLHLAAAGNGTSQSVIDTLIRFYPQSVSVKDDRGLIPLHLTLLKDDGGQQLDLTLLRLLLGQRLAGGGDGVARRASPKRVRDGGMRKKAHLNLQLEQIEEGIFGNNPNAILQKARKRRQEEMKLLAERNGKIVEDGVSRGFARRTNSVDSDDGIPHKHEFLASLWEDENLFGNNDMMEVKSFSEDVKSRLKQLAQWKKRRGIQFDINTAEENPAPYINPATIPAPPHGRLPIHMAVRRNHYAKRRKLEEEAISSLSLIPPKTKQNDILRVLIHAFPTSLINQDAQGCTPLLTCLMSSHNAVLDPIDLEMIELLLGIRTAGFRVAPEWLEDADFVTQHHKDENQVGRNSSRQISLPYNPAMIDSNMTLPLHVAAQEALSPDIVHSIYSCYPGAKYVQNGRKCTPLHCILSNLAGNESLDLDIVSLLMDETVARMKDDTEKGILDLLVLNAKSGRLPRHFKDRSYGNSSNYGPKYHEGKVHIYQSVFHHSIVESLTVSPIGTRKEREFLGQLHLLPPWLRRQACATRTVQQVLLRAVVKPRCTALVFSYGMTLLILVLVFLAMVDQYFSTPPSSLETFQPTGDYAVVIFFCSAYLALYNLCYISMTFRLGVESSECFGSFWTWTTMCGLLCVIVATVQLGFLKQIPGDDDISFPLCTLAVGFLWIMVLGFLSRWWKGCNVFCARFVVMIKRLVPSFIILLIAIASFMQMIYLVQRRTLGFDANCIADSNFQRDDASVCSVWGPFEMIYFIIMGENFLDRASEDGQEKSKAFLIGLLLIFAAFILLLLLQIIGISIITSTSRGTNIAILDKYWVPMLTFVLLVQSFSTLMCNQNEKLSGNDPFQIQSRPNGGENSTRQCSSALESKLHFAWEYVCASYSNADLNETLWWYERRSSVSKVFSNKWFLRCIGLLLVPIWFLLGLVTFGILWPPQLRWRLFQLLSSFENTESASHIDLTHGSIEGSETRKELSKMKAMMYERFHDVQKDIQAFQKFSDDRVS